MNKRDFLKITALGVGSVITAPLFGKSRSKSSLFYKNDDIVFELPELPYAFNALEPYIDEQTMILHYTKHHAAYTEKFNAAVKEAGIKGKSAREILAEVSKYSEGIRNNGGGYFNHKLFWKVLSPTGGGAPKGNLAEAINNAFGSFEDFKKQFSDAAKSVFGSGWAWLIITDDKKLQITTTPNQDSPVMDIAVTKGRPVLLLDVWEHAYYLKYQNMRATYIENFWNIVNWEYAEKKYDSLIAK